LNRGEIREFFFREGLITFDEQPCRRFDMKRDFDTKKYRAFARAAGIPAGMKTEDVLQNLEALTEDGMTNAGTLFFGKRVTKFFLEAKINCAVFQGTSKTKIIDQQICEGSVIETYQAAIGYLQAHLNAEYIIRGGPRQEVLELPLDALREAVLNAIGHRDYRLTGHIQVHISLDRVEIINPGGLVSGLTLADLGRVSRPRNPLLFALMHRMELVEDVGSGIRRIRDEMRSYGLEKPLIETGESWFSIAFRRKPQDASIERQGQALGVTPSATRPYEGVTGGVNEGVSRLLDYIRGHPGLRVPAISLELSVPAKTIERWLKALKQQDAIRFEGSPKKGGYHALPSNDRDG
jgi:ATP-dependent DNA helicase RecG